MRTNEHTGRVLSLDAEQAKAVTHGAGPLCVLGGPGTGKTSVLEERFVRLATADGCSPDRVLLLVPNRAQKIALQDRLTRRLLFDEGLEALVDVPVYTWHGFANHLVSRHYDRLEYPEPPVLLTSPEQWGDVRDALAAESDANWPHYKHLLRNRGFVDEVVDFFIRAKQRDLGEEELDDLARERPEWAEIVRFFKGHKTRLQSRSRVDYPTLLVDAVWLISNYEDLRAGLHARFKHVLVDDAQELPLVQQKLLRFLTPFPESTTDGHSLVVAADPDSAIETFRGAEPDWLRRFADEFGPHDRVTLTTSYRLGPEVGEKAVSFVAAGDERDHRPTTFAGSTVLDVKRFQNLAAEVEAVARELRLAHLRDDVPYDDMAILLTSPRSMLPPLERALEALEVPYSIAAPDRPLEREPSVRWFCNLARLSLVDNPAEEDVLELLRSPLVGLPDVEVRELERLARVRGATLAGVVEDAAANAVPGVVSETARRLAAMVELRDLLRARRARPADEAFWAVWDAADHYRRLPEAARSDPGSPADREIDALVAFSRALGRFVERRRGTGTLAEYLDAIGRADFGSDPWLPPERAAGGVEILSFHGAKGREWSVVAVCGCIEGGIPKGRRARGLFDPYFLDEASVVERARKNEAEDRRVFFVALTRAGSRCIVTTSPGPSRKGQPSRFIEELVGSVPDVEPRDTLPPLTFSEAAARYRRVLADTAAPRHERLASLAGIARICELDRDCAAARPAEWWWRWDWTEGGVALRSQQHSDTDDDLPLDKLRTSYSRISIYDNCGLQYLFAVVLGFDPESSHNMAFGTWIHKIFEECEANVLTNRDAVAARYVELFDDSVFPNKVVARQFRRDGEVMLDRYIRYLKPGRAALAEKRFDVDFNGHLITGRIDRVDTIGKNVVVSDYKTSRYPIHWNDAKDSLQLAIYYLAAKSDADIAALGAPISMQLVYPAEFTVSKNEVGKRCQTPEEAERALERLPGLIEGVLAEDFRPSPEADCKWCRFKPLCPLWAEGKELPA